MISDDKRRAIGKIISVAADRLVVELHRSTDNFTIVGFDDMHYVARLGSFLMIPVQSEYVVAEIIGLREKDPYSASMRADDSGELDKTSSAKYLDLVPVGMLSQDKDGKFSFGVSTFPSLYADALYALDSELDRIFEVKNDQAPTPDAPTIYKALTIGSSVIFQGYDVRVKIDEFFGGHVSVLGNTGSGKSCTVASIVQSLFTKPDEYFARGATFVVFDVNGEYRNAFKNLDSTIKRRYLNIYSKQGVPSPPIDSSESVGSFKLPHWFMNAEEWELLLRASEKTQQPVLRSALGLTSLFAANQSSNLLLIKNHILAQCIQCIMSSESSTPSKVDRVKGILATFQTIQISTKTLAEGLKTSYGQLVSPDKLDAVLALHIKENISIPAYQNEPFSFDDLEKAIDLALLYEEAHGNNQIRDYCAQMVTRYKTIRERVEFEFLRTDPKTLAPNEKSLSLFVESLLGIKQVKKNKSKSHQIVIIDMNDTEDEAVEVLAAVVSRLIFDCLKKSEPRNRFPVNLILEEAHRYVADHPSAYAINAGRIFQRISKEGRKYGLFLLLASQRPSELSRTVLSQCSNYIVHRIQNPDDLAHIRQMTPFISDSVLKRLPSLPKQHALIFGNSVNIPTTFRVRDAVPATRGDDAKISEIWFCPEGTIVGL